MLNRSGLIVLEGLDGSGKSTQFERLSAYFSENDIKHKAISFPDYDNPSSALVKMYLNGEIGKTPADVNAYAASSFYAVDSAYAPAEPDNGHSRGIRVPLDFPPNRPWIRQAVGHFFAMILLMTSSVPER